MRRPIVLILTAYAGGILFGFYVKMNVVLLVPAAGLLFALLLWKFRYKELNGLAGLFSLFLVVFLLGSVWISFRMSREDALLSEVGRTVTLSGSVSGIEKRDEESYRMTLAVKQTKSLVLVNVYGDVPNYADLAGRTIEVSGTLSLPSERRNPKTFDYRLYLKTKGIHVVMVAKPHEITVTDSSINYFTNLLSNMKCGFIEKIIGCIDTQSAAVLTGMLFGDKNALDEEIYEVFQKNGTAHILAVSGIHVGIVYMCFNAVFKVRRNLFLNCLAIAFLFSYAALAAFSPSVMRAVSMIVLHILSKLLHKRYDLLCSGAGVALVMLVINPLSIFNPGFQLSYLAIFILAVMLPAALKIHNGLITPALTLQVGLAPVMAYSFNYFSFAAFVANIPIIFLAGLIIPIGIALIPLSYLPGDIFGIAATAASLLCRLMMWINDLAYMPGISYLHVTSPPLGIVLAYYAVLFFASSEMAWIFYKRKQLLKIGAAIFIGVAVALSFGYSVQDDFHKAQMVFVDVGQGDCLHIRTPSGKNILIDGGGSANYDVGKKVLMPYLLKNGVNKIDMAFVSHRHLDHYGGIVSLCQNFKVDKIFFYEANRMIESEISAETGLDREKFVYLVQGQKIQVGEDVWIEVMCPPRKSDDEYERLVAPGQDENEISLILKIHYKGVTTLMTGDINQDGEKNLIETYQDSGEPAADILKVAHHGSKYSSSEAFIEKVNPNIAVFQVGKNTFGHPTPEVIEKFEGSDAEIFRNDTQGAIAVFIGGEKGKTKIQTIIVDKKSEK